MGGKSGEQAIQGARQCLEEAERIFFGNPQPRPSTGPGLEAEVSSILGKFTGSLEQAVTESLDKVVKHASPAPPAERLAPPAERPAPQEYVPPAGTMVVKVDEQIEVVAEKKALERELELRKEFERKAEKAAEAKKADDSQAVAALARIAEAKEQGSDSLDTLDKMLTLMDRFHGGRAGGGAMKALTAPTPPPPPPPPRSESDLPPGWEAIQTPDGVYYCNRETNVSQYVQARVEHTHHVCSMCDPTFLCTPLTGGTALRRQEELSFHLRHRHRHRHPLAPPEDRHVQLEAARAPTLGIPRPTHGDRRRHENCSWQNHRTGDDMGESVSARAIAPP